MLSSQLWFPIVMVWFTVNIPALGTCFWSNAGHQQWIFLLSIRSFSVSELNVHLSRNFQLRHAGKIYIDLACTVTFTSNSVLNVVFYLAGTFFKKNYILAQ